MLLPTMISDDPIRNMRPATSFTCGRSGIDASWTPRTTTLEWLARAPLGKGDQDDHLLGHEPAALPADRHLGQHLHDRGLSAVDAAHHLRCRSLAEDDHVVVRARLHERLLEPRGHHQDGGEDEDDERHPGNRQDRRQPALPEIPHAVGEGNGHQPILRNPSAMPMRIARRAGMIAAKKAIRKAARRSSQSVSVRDDEDGEVGRKGMAEGLGRRKGQDHPGQAAGQGDHEGFAEDHDRDIRAAEPQGLHDRVIADPLPGGHGHGVGDDRHDDEDDDEGDHLDGRDDGPAHGDEPLVEGLLRLGERLGQGVLEGLVHGQGHIRRHIRPGDGDHVEAHLVRPSGERPVSWFR